MRHRVMVTLLALTGAAFVLWLTWQGVGYYKLPLADRPFHPQHSDLKPAGHTGIRLGVISLGLFLLLFLYPLRKRVKFLQRIGKTRRWLDFHILLGLTVPLLVTLHSSLKLKGLAGMAYWIMMAIVASGIVGRYLYAQIPRSLNAAELSLREIQEQSEALADQIRSQNVFNEGDLAAVLAHAADVASLDLDGVPPTAHPLPLRNVLRADVVRPSLDRDEVLASAPAAEDGRFRVPRILDAP